MVWNCTKKVQYVAPKSFWRTVKLPKLWRDQEVVYSLLSPCSFFLTTIASCFLSITAIVIWTHMIGFDFSAVACPISVGKHQLRSQIVYTTLLPWYDLSRAVIFYHFFSGGWISSFMYWSMDGSGQNFFYTSNQIWINRRNGGKLFLFYFSLFLDVFFCHKWMINVLVMQKKFFFYCLPI